MFLWGIESSPEPHSACAIYILFPLQQSIFLPAFWDNNLPHVFKHFQTSYVISSFAHAGTCMWFWVMNRRMSHLRARPRLEAGLVGLGENTSLENRWETALLLSPQLGTFMALKQRIQYVKKSQNYSWASCHPCEWCLHVQAVPEYVSTDLNSHGRKKYK